MALTQQTGFLKKIPPFDSLPLPVVEAAAAQMDVVYFPVDDEVKLVQGGSHYLYFVIKGAVGEFQEQALVTRYAVRGYFGEQRLLAQSGMLRTPESDTGFKVLEEAILYRMPAEVFKQLLLTQPAFHDYFMTSMVDKLDKLHQSMQIMASTEVMMDMVCSAPVQPLLMLAPHTTLQQAVEHMVEQGTDACVVSSIHAEGHGLVTTTDILRAIAAGQSLNDTALAELANRPLVTVHEFDYLFNALLKLTKYNINRLVVRSDEGLKGFLNQRELMSLFANQSGVALLKVEQAECVADLKQVAAQIDQLVVNLHRKGIKTHYIAKLVNELHRKLFYKLFNLLMPDGKKMLDKICFLVMGSEGRSEQVLRTDQDNAIVFEGLTFSEQKQLEEWTPQFTQALVEIGFPRCPGLIMVSNPMWCQPIERFSAQLKSWFDRPSEQTFMQVAIFFDAQTVFGNEALLHRLRADLFARVQEQPIFLAHFAKAVLQFETPIGFFGGLRTDKNNGQESIDLKKSAIFPIVHGVRCYALQAGLEQTNTHWRIKALMDRAVFSEAFGVELGEALNFFHTLRLESMLYQLAQGRSPAALDSSVAVHRLTHLQQDLLKQALGMVNEFKKKVHKHFKLNEVM
jgi:CBS domain-containing protein